MKPLVIANWKENPQTLAEAKQLFDSIKEKVKNIESSEIIICPPFSYFSVFESEVLGNIKLGAQDISEENYSVKKLREIGCEYVILGHSERRINLCETDETVNKKLKETVKNNLKPILCVGDRSREKKEDIEEISFQLKEDLKGFDAQSLNDLIIVYEPIWAISTMGGRVAEIQDIKESIDFIKKNIAELFEERMLKVVKILYGGSINKDNAQNIIKETGVDGLLIGHASLDPIEFIGIIKKVEKF